MKLHELRSAPGARTERRRVGRGTGSGHGKTSGRGQKGQLARGQGFRVGFEGGQMPITQRLPKLGGFKNPFKQHFAIVNLTRLNGFDEGARVGPDAFVAAGLAEDGEKVKVLGAGRLRRKLTVEAHAFSQTARAAIEAKGGEVVMIGEPRRRRQRSKKAGPAESESDVGAERTEAAAGGPAEPAAEPAAEAASESSNEPEPAS
jgi:large subunit ribosomal protein L15